jgi:transcription antitermination factor NusG
VWLAVWTKPRAEKAVAKKLQGRAITCWLPTYTLKRRWSDRWKEVEFPLFPGYLFALNPIESWSALLRVPGVLTVVKQGKQPAPIPPSELANLQVAIERLTSTGEEPEVVADFAPGERVRVVDGPMAGLVGVVREKRGKARLLVGFEQVGQALAVSIGAATLEKCGDWP